MTMSVSYIRQQYGNAVATLCTHPAGLRTRLEIAVRESILFAGDPGSDVPPVLAAAAVTELHDRLTSAVPAAADEGTASASVWILTEEQATDAAHDILRLHSNSESAYQRPEQWNTPDD